MLFVWFGFFGWWFVSCVSCLFVWPFRCLCICLFFQRVVHLMCVCCLLFAIVFCVVPRFVFGECYLCVCFIVCSLWFACLLAFVCLC